MAEIISIRFKREGKQYYFNPNGLTIEPGDGVILETSWGVEFGQCVLGNHEVRDEELVAPLRPILRLATEADQETVRKNRQKEAQAMQLCQQKIGEHQLEMKLVDVEYSFEGTKILFFFTSEGRVDFRNLVKDLASVFHTRIELRQIGVRDEAKMLGGLGICGRAFCCSSFLREFQPVSIKMAKTQSLSLNPAKISGTCGRLMCCLKYEQFAYEDLLKNSPRADSFVETPDGVGDIINVNTLREQVRVRLDNAPDSLKIYHNSEVRVVRSGKGRRPEDYVPPHPRELEKLRRATEASTADDALNDSLRRFMDETPPPASPPPRQENRSSEQRRGGPRGGDRRERRGEHQGNRNRPPRPPQEQKRPERPAANTAPETQIPAPKIQEPGAGEMNQQNRRRGGRGRGGKGGQQGQSPAANAPKNQQNQGQKHGSAAPQKPEGRKEPKETNAKPAEKSGEGSKRRRPPWRKRPNRGEKGPSQQQE